MSGCIACDMGHEPKEMFVMNVDLQMPVEEPTIQRTADFVRKWPGGCVAYVKERVQGEICYAVVHINLNAMIHVMGKGSPISHLNLQRTEFVGWVHKRGSKFFARKAKADRARRKGSSSLKKATAWLI